jgi:hypothetical protein
MRVRSDCYENFLGVRILGGTPRAGSVQKELRVRSFPRVLGELLIVRKGRKIPRHTHSGWRQRSVVSPFVRRLKERAENFGWPHFGGGSFGLFFHRCFVRDHNLWRRRHRFWVPFDRIGDWQYNNGSLRRPKC